jgi:hypothetical protein
MSDRILIVKHVGAYISTSLGVQICQEKKEKIE